MRLRDRRSLRAPQRLDDGVKPGQQQPESRGTTPAPITQQGDQQQVLQPQRQELSPSPPAPALAPKKKIMPASARPKHPMTYVEYDPTLPPAAFPTLDKPVPPAARKRGGEGEGEGEAERQGQGGPNDTDGEIQCEPMQGVIVATGRPIEPGGLEDTSDIEWDDAKSMEAMMETSDEEEEEEVEEDVHDNNEGGVIKEFQVPNNVSWADITPQLRAEIMVNVMSEYGGRAAMLSALGLDPTEARKTLMTLRDKQIEREDVNLRQMLENQRNALFRIDYSVRQRMRVPEELVFHEFSHRYYSRRQQQTSSDQDLFMSKASDVLVARQFLRQRSLDVKLAGEWTNPFASFEADKYDGGQDKLGWISDESFGDDGRGIEQDTVARLGVKKPSGSSRASSSSPEKRPDNNSLLDMRSKVGFINQFSDNSAPGQPLTENSMPLPRLNFARRLLNRKKTGARSRPTRDQPAQTSTTAPATARGERDRIVRLRIGPQGAAKIQENYSSTAVAPAASLLASSQPQQPTYAPQNPSPLKATEKTAPVEARDTNPMVAGNPRVVASSPPPPINPSNVRREHKLPARRVLAGSWWYNSGSNQAESSTSFSANLDGLPLAARAETELQRLNQEKSGRDSKGAAVDSTFENNLPVRMSKSSPPPRLSNVRGDGQATVDELSLCHDKNDVERQAAIPPPRNSGHEQPDVEPVAATTKQTVVENAKPVEHPKPNTHYDWVVSPGPFPDFFLGELEITTPLSERQRGRDPEDHIVTDNGPDKGKQKADASKSPTDASADVHMANTEGDSQAAEAIENNDVEMDKAAKADIDANASANVHMANTEDDSPAAVVIENKDVEMGGSAKADADASVDMPTVDPADNSEPAAGAISIEDNQKNEQSKADTSINVEVVIPEPKDNSRGTDITSIKGELVNQETRTHIDANCADAATAKPEDGSPQAAAQLQEIPDVNSAEVPRPSTLATRGHGMRGTLRGRRPRATVARSRRLYRPAATLTSVPEQTLANGSADANDTTAASQEKTKQVEKAEKAGEAGTPRQGRAMPSVRRGVRATLMAAARGDRLHIPRAIPESVSEQTPAKITADAKSVTTASEQETEKTEEADRPARGRGTPSARRGGKAGRVRGLYIPALTSVSEKTPAKRSADTEDITVAAQWEMEKAEKADESEKPATKKRKSSKKEKPAAPTRTSERINPGGRRLRPRNSTGEANT